MKNLSILLVLLFLCGCGGDHVQVTGTVKFADGSPLTLGTVKFIGDMTQATGKIKDGTYVLGELKPGDGIKPGQYKVVVAGASTGGGTSGTPVIYLIDLKFEEAPTSGLTCEVKGRMKYDIKVEPPK